MGSGSDEVEQLRKEIDESRENLGDAVGALAYKADVKNRGKEAIEDKKEVLMEKVDDLKSKMPAGGGDSGDGGGGMSAVKDKLPDGEAIKSKVPSSVGDATPSKDDLKQKAQGAAETAKDNPIPLVAGAAAAGLVAGLALPETDLEREKIGPKAQEARQQVQSKVQDTVQQAKSSAQSAAQNVAGAVKQKGQEQGGKVGELAETAADKTQEKMG